MKIYFTKNEWDEYYFYNSGHALQNGEFISVCESVIDKLGIKFPKVNNEFWRSEMLLVLEAEINFEDSFKTLRIETKLAKLDPSVLNKSNTKKTKKKTLKKKGSKK